MVASWKRGCVLLTIGMLVGLLGACSLLSLGVASQVIALPPRLMHNHLFWIGDRCRADQGYKRQHDCLPGYTVDLYVYGHETRHYRVFRIPALR